jgi:DNA repair photolyase
MPKNLIIYEPSGPALEYSLLGLNHYAGCPCACTYCYGPRSMHKTRAEFHAAAVPKKDVLARVGKAAKHFRGTDKRVLLSFASDPYPEIDCARALTRDVLSILKRHDVSFQVLTKSGLLAARDFDQYRPCDAFAVTLTTADKHRAAEIEPGAAPPADRIWTLREAHKRGIETWVSLEPVLDNFQALTDALEVIRQAGPHTDLFKIGAIGGGKKPRAIAPDHWRGFIKRAAVLCTAHGSRYFFKESLTCYLESFEFAHPIDNTDNRLVGWRDNE